MKTYIPQYMSRNHLGSCKMSPVPTSTLEVLPRTISNDYIYLVKTFSFQVKLKLHFLILLSLCKQLHLMEVTLDTFLERCGEYQQLFYA